jgi:hypothetical protein
MSLDRQHIWGCSQQSPRLGPIRATSALRDPVRVLQSPFPAPSSRSYGTGEARLPRRRRPIRNQPSRARGCPTPLRQWPIRCTRDQRRPRSRRDGAEPRAPPSAIAIPRRMSRAARLGPDSPMTRGCGAFECDRIHTVSASPRAAFLVESRSRGSSSVDR